MNDKQIKNLAHFTHCEIIGFSKAKLLQELEHKEKFKFTNENELQQDKAHIRKLPMDHLLYIKRDKHHAYILQDKPAKNSVQHMAQALKAINTNQMLRVNFYM